MFDRLISWLGSAWEELWKVLNVIWEGLRKFQTSVWGVLVVFIGILKAGFEMIKDAVVDAFNILDGVFFPDALPAASGTLTYYFNFCNTFLPLEEAFAFAVSWFGLVVALATYRFLRSLIPVPTSR